MDDTQRILGRMEGKLDVIAQDVKEQRDLLTGENGLILRVDRVEQSHKRARWFMGAVLGVPVLWEAVWAFLKRSN